MEQSFAGDHDPRTDHASQIFPLCGDVIKGGGSPKIDDDGCVLKGLIGGNRIDHAIRPDFLGIVVKNRHAGPNTRTHNQRSDVEVFPAETLNNMEHRRHDAGDDHLLHVGHAALGGPEKAADDDPIFIDGAVDFGSDAPVVDELLAPEEPHDGIGIADIHGKEHVVSSLLVNHEGAAEQSLASENCFEKLRVTSCELRVVR